MSFWRKYSKTDRRNKSGDKAGLFLQKFVGNIPFAHIDIAGTAFLTQMNWIRALDNKFKICSKEITNFKICYKALSRPGFWLNVEGATGFGVRLLVEYLKNLTQ